MQRIKEIIVVEGRYDINTLKQVVDATVVETCGFGIFSDSEKVKLIRALSRERGVIVMTDSDGAGFVIRNRLKNVLKDCNVKHAYIPDVYGKERRKATASKEGKLGVEGMKAEVILEALRKAGATFDGVQSELRGGITKADMFALGLTGGEDSAERRAELLQRLELPSQMTAKGLLGVLNVLFTREELFTFMEQKKT